MSLKNNPDILQAEPRQSSERDVMIYTLCAHFLSLCVGFNARDAKLSNTATVLFAISKCGEDEQWLCERWRACAATGDDGRQLIKDVLARCAGRLG